MSFVTLLTDFGLRDGAVGLMKGVIWRIAPGAQIADLSHNIAAQNILEAAIVLRFAVPYFPDGTVHIAVVDPGVGTARRSLAARLGPYYFVAPDNGLITPLLQMAAERDWPVQMVELDRPAYWLPVVSDIFHGRDVYAPVGAHLAAGVPLADLGTPLDDPVLIDLPGPERTAAGLRGQVIFIDDFGNIHTNILRRHLAPFADEVIVRLRGTDIDGLVRTFGQRPPGALIALYGTENDLMVSVVNGNATERLGAVVGDTVEIIAKT